MPFTRGNLGPVASRRALPSNLTQVCTFYIPSDLITSPASCSTCFPCHSRQKQFQDGTGLPLRVVMSPGACENIAGL